MKPKVKNDRAYYRLQYPSRERPVLRVGEQEYPVCELSEGGLRIQGSGLGKAVFGILCLRDGRRLPITAVVGRRYRHEIVLVNLSGVPYRVILAEQQRLVRRYLLI